MSELTYYIPGAGSRDDNFKSDVGKLALSLMFLVILDATSDSLEIHDFDDVLGTAAKVDPTARPLVTLAPSAWFTFVMGADDLLLLPVVDLTGKSVMVKIIGD